MKQFRIAPETFDIFPHLEIGAVVLRGIDNTQGGPEAAEGLARACAALEKRLAEAGGTLPEIQTFADAMKKFVRKKGCRASLDAMARRIAKGDTVGSINPAVDLYNTVCLTHLFTCGGENLARIEGDMVLGLAAGTEPFIPLGEQENAPPRPGELVYRDDAGVVVRSWVWRESDRTKIDAGARDILLYMENIDPSRRGALRDALDDLYERASLLGGERTRHLISAEQPACAL